MRKLALVIFAVFMGVAAIGNLIGGTDTPVTGAIGPPDGVQTEAGFDTTLYVSASALNLREAPSPDAPILTTLPQNTRVSAGERRNGWVLVSAANKVGWVSGDYLSSAPVTPVLDALSRQTPSQPPPSRLTSQPTGPSCGPRKYCRQMRSCDEAIYYMRNCSWGRLLDGDSDGTPCESICR